MKSLEKTLKTADLDMPLLAEKLHAIRKDAQHMENALKHRKSMMEKAGIESLYQRAKDAHKPQGINKIPDEVYQINEKPQYELTIKNGEEIMYQNMVESGVVCAVEKLEGMDTEGHINGQTQTFVFGGTIGWWFAFDQLRQSIEGKRLEISSALKEMARNNNLLDPEVRKKMLGL